MWAGVSPVSPGADVKGMSPVSPGADVGGGEPGKSRRRCGPSPDPYTPRVPCEYPVSTHRPLRATARQRAPRVVRERVAASGIPTCRTAASGIPTCRTADVAASGIPACRTAGGGGDGGGERCACEGAVRAAEQLQSTPVSTREYPVSNL
jgi:hypothetical protein